MKILVLDDEPVIVDVIAEMVQHVYEVHKATHVRDALVLIETVKFDVLISDFNMPGMDGVSFGELAKGYNPDIKVLIITGSDDADSLVGNGTVDAVIRKPINWLNMLRVLEDICLISDGGAT